MYFISYGYNKNVWAIVKLQIYFNMTQDFCTIFCENEQNQVSLTTDLIRR